MKLSTLDQVDVAGKVVLVRADYNVPLKNNKVTDVTRIKKTVATIQELREKKARVVLISHLGRPKGHNMPEYSLRPVAASLYKELGQVPVFFSDETIGLTAASLIDSLQPGEVALLENLRFYPEEERNDENFAAKLAQLADIYVNDAFSVCHRAHASVDAITKFLPSYAGRLLQEEIRQLETQLHSPRRPVMAIVGGAKISTKLNLLKSLAQRVDVLAIGGGMANTFLHAQGYEVGQSLCEKEMKHEAVQILADLSRRGCVVILPTDVVVAAEPVAGVKSRIVPVTDVPKDQMILDVGPKTIDDIISNIDHCKTLIWNGSIGVNEIAPFEYATMLIARHAAMQTQAGKLISIAGGGDTAAALNQASCYDDFTYVSMGGGAFLEWLEGKPMPGIEALHHAAQEGIIAFENITLGKE
tara:strand:+ start:30089 stop:31333 length:1245 start_codon:yes stop_codon:yes gene_type:complete